MLRNQCFNFSRDALDFTSWQSIWKKTWKRRNSADDTRAWLFKLLKRWSTERPNGGWLFSKFIMSLTHLWFDADKIIIFLFIRMKIRSSKHIAEKKSSDLGRTLIWILLIRSLTRYPLRQGLHLLKVYLEIILCRSTSLAYQKPGMRRDTLERFWVLKRHAVSLGRHLPSWELWSYFVHLEPDEDFH